MWQSNAEGRQKDFVDIKQVVQMKGVHITNADYLQRWYMLSNWTRISEWRSKCWSHETRPWLSFVIKILVAGRWMGKSWLTSTNGVTDLDFFMEKYAADRLIGQDDVHPQRAGWWGLPKWTSDCRVSNVNLLLDAVLIGICCWPNVKNG